MVLASLNGRRHDMKVTTKSVTSTILLAALISIVEVGQRRFKKFNTLRHVFKGMTRSELFDFLYFGF